VSKVISIDYGLKRIGIAISDLTQTIASPLTCISHNDIYNFLDDLIVSQKISDIVVGYAVNLDGSSTDITSKTRSFVENLNTRFFKIRIHMIDERFTSKIAKQAILNSGVSKKKRSDKSLVDMVSATLILQDYLNHK
tara:strand:- start:483 stop:893 length:411 start_codon:yes stop_codon:yes gene_type:complete